MQVKPYFNLGDAISVISEESKAAIRSIKDHGSAQDRLVSMSFSLAVSEAHARDLRGMYAKYFDPDTNSLRIEDGDFQKNGVHIASIAKYYIYNLSLVTVRLEEALHTKRLGVGELVATVVETLDGPRLMSLCIYCRALIEHVAKFNHLHAEIAKLLDGVDEAEPESLKQFMLKFQPALHKVVRGSRIDLVDVLANGIRETGETQKEMLKSGVDLNPQSILSAVDKLGKVVDSTRGAYDFCCEFAHPNASTTHCFIERIETPTTNSSGGIPISKKTYNAKQPSQAIGTFKRPLEDLVVIVAELLDLVVDLDCELSGPILDRVRKLARKHSRSIIRKQPTLFSKREPCLCGSGKNIGYCCGKMINKLR